MAFLPLSSSSACAKYYALAGEPFFLQAELLSRKFSSKQNNISSFSPTAFSKEELVKILHLFKKSWGAESEISSSEKSWGSKASVFYTKRGLIWRSIKVAEFDSLKIVKVAWRKTELYVKGFSKPLQRAIFVICSENYLQPTSPIGVTLDKVKTSVLWRLLAEVRTVTIFHDGALVLELSKNVESLSPVKIIKHSKSDVPIVEEDGSTASVQSLNFSNRGVYSFDLKPELVPQVVPIPVIQKRDSQELALINDPRVYVEVS